MSYWVRIEDTLTHELSEFLAGVLPQVSKQQWWKKCVLAKLTKTQLDAFGSIGSGDLHALDLAALLRIAEGNWAEIKLHSSVDSSGRKYLKELLKARHRFAHRTVKGVSLEQLLCGMQSAKQLLKAIKADAASLVLCDSHIAQIQCAIEAGPQSDGNKKTAGSKSGGTQGYGDSGIIDGPSFPGGESASGSLGTAETDNAGGVVFVGIDFGTSTTVVSVASLDEQRNFTANTLKLTQPDRYGGTVRDHRVNSVLALHKQKLLFGRDAYLLRPRLFEDIQVFSSFKMQLGVEIGPTYPRSELRQGKHETVVESARDATTVFLKFVVQAIEEELRVSGQLPDIRYIITVPASFEANQRRALLQCAHRAGMSLESNCLIDEPNAAFLSFMDNAANQYESRMLRDRIKEAALNLMVYDFGAGTCDISILQIENRGNSLKSRNLSISKFCALGGDDIDRAIAEKVLVPQLHEQNPELDLTDTVISELIVPRLMPTAEQLKVVANKWLAERSINEMSELKNIAQSFSAHDVMINNGKHGSISLKQPTMRLVDFANAVGEYLSTFNELEPGKHVFAPVDDALAKSGLRPDEVHAVLFIGGSSASPLVQRCVMKHLPDSVISVVPRDLQSHVSVGAAIHCVCLHRLNRNIIQPITSEPIFIVTRGGRLVSIVPSSAEVPSAEPFELTLCLEQDRQHIIELPVCVSSESKLLGLLRLEAPDEQGFAVGTEIHITATLTIDKLLNISATTASASVGSQLLDPLANRELSNTERQLLEAKQRFNHASLQANGRPSPEEVLIYAYAAQRAGEHLLAADLFRQVDATVEGSDHATNISYSYSRCDRLDLAEKWCAIAYKRKPCALTAYNMACRAAGDLREKYLRESLSFDANYDSAQIMLGKLLKSKGIDEGSQLLRRAVRGLSAQLENHEICKSDCSRLVTAASALGDTGLADRAKARLDSLTGSFQPYHDRNLADSLDSSLYQRE